MYEVNVVARFQNARLEATVKIWTLVTRISNENHVDPEQIGGYLISLDYNEIVKNGISSAFASSSSSSTLSLSSFGSVLSNNNNNDLILTSGSAFPSNPGIVRSHDYLSVDARIPNVYDGSPSNITIIRFCLINNSTLKTIATKTKTKLPEVEMINSSSSLSSPYSSISSGSFSLNSIDYNKLYAPDESYLVGQIYDPISNVYGLQFTSN
ncbi:hypothetical protein MS3_00011098 [Schistosoma haematobium]|uniref:Uncharacterized protein n=1 Tax=Schistosoma haematobium TaxID=6185 RepID=A0A922LE18_SCHHA|nr:hypothetical protein MS3_00011098 [Schistosoma haematobium]KAH9580216.1 hypothetical protein MS3_00011098 [Schistosoma haematobium]